MAATELAAGVGRAGPQRPPAAAVEAKRRVCAEGGAGRGGLIANGSSYVDGAGVEGAARERSRLARDKSPAPLSGGLSLAAAGRALLLPFPNRSSCVSRRPLPGRSPDYSQGDDREQAVASGWAGELAAPRLSVPSSTS